MRLRLIIVFAATLICGASIFMRAENSSANADQKNGKSSKILRHVVLFKFKEATTPEQVKEIVDAFAALPQKIDTIHDFEWGTDVSPEMKSDGFTHCFFVSFTEEKGRDAYLPHPAHQAFVKIVGPHVEKVLVVDYWAKK